jgi:deoxyribodipyrimidine photo-lyase
MIANRRLTYNFALDRALEYCRELRKPLVIFEALRCGYQWASDRFHRFVIDGMAENAGACERHHIQYYPYVEPKPGAGKGLLEAFAADACVVITDEFPCFFLPRDGCRRRQEVAPPRSPRLQRFATSARWREGVRPCI